MVLRVSTSALLTLLVRTPSLHCVKSRGQPSALRTQCVAQWVRAVNNTSTQLRRLPVCTANLQCYKKPCWQPSALQTQCLTQCKFAVRTMDVRSADTLARNARYSLENLKSLVRLFVFLVSSLFCLNFTGSTGFCQGFGPFFLKIHWFSWLFSGFRAARAQKKMFLAKIDGFGARS